MSSQILPSGLPYTSIVTIWQTDNAIDLLDCSRFGTLKSIHIDTLTRGESYVLGLGWYKSDGHDMVLSDEEQHSGTR